MVYTATANDADGNTLTFSINGGADQSAFSINANNGELSLLNAADFDNPNDADADGIFVVNLGVSDGNGGTDQMTLSITIEERSKVNLQMRVTYPTPNANLGGNAKTTSVTGYLKDLEGSQVVKSDLVSFEINDQLISSFTFAEDGRWLVEDVPVAENLNIKFELSDAPGEVQEINQALRNAVPFHTPQALALDSVNNRVFIVDTPFGRFNATVIAVDLVTGERTLVSSSSKGTGVDLDTVLDIVFDDISQRLLVTSASFSSDIVAIDIESGDRTIVSQIEDGNGEDFRRPQSFALDSLNQQLFVTAPAPALKAVMVINVDPDSADFDKRTVVSKAGDGKGVDGLDFEAPYGLALNPATKQLFVSDIGLKTVVVVNVDPDSAGFGQRAILSQTGANSGPNFGSPSTIAFDIDNQRLLGAARSRILAVDPLNGNSSILSNVTNGNGVNLHFPTGLALDSVNNQLLVADFYLDAVIAVALDNGNRTLISANESGLGPQLNYPAGLTLDAGRNRVLLNSTSSPTSDGSQVIAVNLDSGNRTIVSGEEQNGPEISSGRGLAMDIPNNRILVIDEFSGALVAVDLTSGDRSILSDDNVGGGDREFFNPTDIAIDAANNRALVIDDGGLIAVDLTSGKRKLISQNEDFDSLRAIVLDTTVEPTRALVIDRADVMTVNLDNGERDFLSDNSDAGQGESFLGPDGIAIDAVRNRALALGSLEKIVFAVDLSSGEQQRLVSIPATSSGTFLEYIVVDSENNRAFILDNIDKLYVMDLATNEVAISSKSLVTSGF